ncbi:MAG: MFS transporter [Sphingomonas sp.]
MQARSTQARQGDSPTPDRRSETYRQFRWVYGRAHYGRTLLWHSSELLFAFFINQRAGIPPLLMGGILVTGLVSSAGIDLAVASALRSVPFTLERTLRLQLAGAVASAIAITAFFATDLLPPAWRFLYALSVAVIFRIAYAVGDIPHNAILSLATSDFESRRELSTIRLFFSGLASITVAAIFTLLLGNPALNRPGVFAIGALFLSAAVIVVAFRLARYKLAPPATRSFANAVSAPRYGGLKSAAIVRLLLMMGLLSGAISAFTILEPFYVTSSYGADAKRTIILASSVGLTLAQPFWSRICRNRTSLSTTTFAVFALILSLISFGFADLAGYAGQPLISFLFGVANGGIGMAMWSSYAEEVARRGIAHNPMSFALLTCFAKLGSASATILISLSLFAGKGMVSPLAMTWGPAALAILVLLIHVGWRDGPIGSSWGATSRRNGFARSAMSPDR